MNDIDSSNSHHVVVLATFQFTAHAFLIDSQSMYRVWQKYLTTLQNSCEWNRWCGEFVLERPSSETQSISVAMERWSVQHRAFAVETYLKKTILSCLRRYFAGTSIFIGTSVPSRYITSSEDISKARCTKRDQGQRRI
jgi:hypothetical protein